MMKPMIEHEDLLNAMSIYIALHNRMRALAAQQGAEWVSHGQIKCCEVTSHFTSESTLKDVISYYETTTDPVEEWISELGFVFSVLAQHQGDVSVAKGCAKELYEEMNKIEGFDEEILRARSFIFTRNPYGIDHHNQPCCGLFGERGCSLM